MRYSAVGSPSKQRRTIIGTRDIEEAFKYCKQIARSHYENFPVASCFLPRDRRPFLYSIYAFARIADDVADEGALDPEERLRRLDDWEAKLDDCFAGKADHPVFVALAETAARTGVPRQPFADLLDAFRMDVTKKRFVTFAEVLDYCTKSANPVGRLVLHVFGDAGEHTVPCSDSLCTALQLANFWQDVAVDRAKGRVYIPLEDFERFGYTESDLARNLVDERLRKLIEFQVDRTRDILMKGRPLLDLVTRELRFELGLIYRGGMAILRKIETSGYDVLTHRPVLTLPVKVVLALRTMLRTTA